MPRSTGIQRTAPRTVTVRAATPLAAEPRTRLIALLASGLERYLAGSAGRPEMLIGSASGAIHARHPEDEVTYG